MISLTSYNVVALPTLSSMMKTLGKNAWLLLRNTYHNICIWAWTWFWGCATFGSAMGIWNDSWFGGGVERFCYGRCTGSTIMNWAEPQFDGGSGDDVFGCTKDDLTMEEGWSFWFSWWLEHWSSSGIDVFGRIEVELAIN